MAGLGYRNRKEYCHFDFDDPVGAEGYGSSPQPGKLVFTGRSVDKNMERGFMDPRDVTIPRLDDEIKEGNERLCVATSVTSASEIFLSLKENFPNRVDELIFKTGNMYQDYLSEFQRSELLPPLDKLEVGSIVIANVEDEWNRAKIVSIKDNHQGYRPSYNIFLLDLGEYHRVGSNALYYIHKDLAKQPMYSIQASLLPEAYEEYGKRFGSKDEWDKVMGSVFLEWAMEKSLMVKFIKRVEKEVQGEKIWEVSILHVEGRDVEDLRGISLDQELFMCGSDRMKSKRVVRFK